MAHTPESIAPTPPTGIESGFQRMPLGGGEGGGRCGLVHMGSALSSSVCSRNVPGAADGRRRCRRRPDNAPCAPARGPPPVTLLRRGQPKRTATAGLHPPPYSRAEGVGVGRKSVPSCRRAPAPHPCAAAAAPPLAAVGAFAALTLFLRLWRRRSARVSAVQSVVQCRSSSATIEGTSSQEKKVGCVWFFPKTGTGPVTAVGATGG